MRKVMAESESKYWKISKLRLLGLVVPSLCTASTLAGWRDEAGGKNRNS